MKLSEMTAHNGGSTLSRWKQNPEIVEEIMFDIFMIILPENVMNYLELCFHMCFTKKCLNQGGYTHTIPLILTEALVDFNPRICNCHTRQVVNWFLVQVLQNDMEW